MTIPQPAAIEPVLIAMMGDGAPWHLHKLVVAVADHFGLSLVERMQAVGVSGQAVIYAHVYQAMDSLNRAGTVNHVGNSLYALRVEPPHADGPAEVKEQTPEPSRAAQADQPTSRRTAYGLSLIHI